MNTSVEWRDVKYNEIFEQELRGLERRRKSDPHCTAADIEGVLQSVASAGYDGVEIGFHRLNADDSENYVKYLRENNLEQAAIHIGGNYNDAESVKQQIANIPRLIKFTHAVGCKNIVSSGSPADYGTDYKSVCENINKLGKVLNENGLTLSYHNHDWEIKDDCFGLYALCDNTDPEYLSFATDVGWVERGGGDPVSVVKRLGNRIALLHFKEYKKDGGITELGIGVVNFKEVYETLNKNIWIISEQDGSDIGADISVKRNCEFIKGIL